MNEPNEEEEEGILPRPPAAANKTALPQVQLRSTDRGVANKKAPHHSSISPPANEMAITSSSNTATATLALLGPAEPLSKMAVSKTPTAHLNNVAHPSQKNRRKGEGGPGKMLKNRVHRINSRQDEEIVSTDDYDDLTTTSATSSMRPGAVAVGDVATRSGRSSTPQTTGQLVGDSVRVTDPGTLFEPQIVAFLAPEDDEQQVESRIAQKAEELLRRQMEEGEVIVAAEVKDDDSSTCCGLKKRTMLLLGVLSLLMIIGGVVGGVLSAMPTPAPTTLGDALLDELMLLNATFEKDLWQFQDPKSPQYQALEWMKNDTIVMSSGRSTLDLLQRYTLAVLFYSANGPNWGWSKPYLSSDAVCSWNNGTDGYGVYCRLDGESVDELKLSDDSIAGLGLELPWELGLLTHLTIVQLDFSQLTGTLPTQLGQLVSLKSLDITFNLTGTIPTELGQLVSLTSLVLESNHLTGTIPTELAQLVSLESLFLDFNELTGTIPTKLGQLVSLTSLGITNNALTGTLPTELAQIVSLESLVLDFNELTGTLPTELGQLVSLQYLGMYSNQLTGTIPTELGQLVSLQFLVLDSNQLTGTIPTELGQLVSLQSLGMHYNPLTGTIPTELGQLVSLESLDLDSNQLTGTLPTELGQLLSLEFLALGSNQLTGTIPTELGQLLSLAVLGVDSNQLNGTIPSELGQLVSLESLGMRSNQLTGTIPTELGQFVSLTSLQMGSNQLTGTIPSELAGFDNLIGVYFFSENSLTGSLEQSFCVENRTAGSYYWFVDCDKVECSCCDCA